MQQSQEKVKNKEAEVEQLKTEIAEKEKSTNVNVMKNLMSCFVSSFIHLLS